MRISDWSSDVCSSDLVSVWLTPLQHQPNNRLRCRFVIRFIELGLAGHGADLPVEIGIGLGGGPDAEHQVVGVDGGDLAAVDPGLDAEIGRASCRERVWQYGEI